MTATNAERAALKCFRCILSRLLSQSFLRGVALGQTLAEIGSRLLLCRREGLQRLSQNVEADRGPTQNFLTVRSRAPHLPPPIDARPVHSHEVAAAQLIDYATHLCR